MFFEIDFSQKSAVLLHELVDLVRDLALVKSVAPFLADQVQRFCQCRIFENVAFRRRPVFAVERVSFKKSAGKSFIKFRAEVPVERDQFRDRETFFCIMDRWCEIVAQFQFPELFMELGPGIHRSRHADRQHAARRNRFAIEFVELGFHLLVTQTERRTSAPVDP